MSSIFASVKEKSGNAINKAKNAVGISTPEPEPSAIDEVAEMCPQLSFKQRIIGFATCFALGYLVTFSSFNYFEVLIAGNPVPFVIIYSLGNIISLFSSMFLCGPKRQIKRMFDDKRKVTTIVYLSTLAVSIVVCFIPFPGTPKLVILLLLLVTQFFASIWYTLSYIPMARRTVLRFFKKEFGDDEV